ncbi:DUF2244 domain-containing protein [Bordetella petrii]|nr:DUF2244 domain-containing protein [Bordetella petrii]
MSVDIMRSAHAYTGAPPSLPPPRARDAPPVAAGGEVEQRWVLKRNCCVTPRQFLLGMAGTAGIALVVSLVFSWRGLWLVGVYGALEIALIAGATLSFARHVRDGETVTLLTDGRMIIDVYAGGTATRHVFNRNWARLVRQPEAPDSLWLHYGAVRLRLARHVPSERRRDIETELRRTLPWRGPTASRAARERALHGRST